jgi:CheY-like chemotaxis protein
MLLTMMGHEVETADGGEEAVAAARESRPDVILLDLGMPQVDGYEAARRIRAEPWGGEPWIVALTGWGADDDRRRTRDAGFDRHLVKPIDLDVLTELIAAIPVNDSLPPSGAGTASRGRR